MTSSTSNTSLQRRTFLKFAALAGFAGGVIAKDITGDVLEISKKFAIKKYNEFNRSELLTKILLDFDVANIALATEGVPKGKITYSNEEVGYAAIRSYFGEAKYIFEADYLPVLSIDNSIISLGGSATNLYARDILGTLANPKFRYKIPNSGHFIELPYSMTDLDSAGVKRIQDGEVHTSIKRRAIISMSKEIFKPRINKDRELQEDFLLVTRVPLDSSRFILLFSGLHGPSIRGIADLLYKLNGTDLDKLEKVYNATDHHGFQAIFRCDQFEIDHKHNGYPTTAPTRIKLLEGMIHPLKFRLG